MRYFEQAAVFTEACLEYRLIKINQENSILPPLPSPPPSPPLPFLFSLIVHSHSGGDGVLGVCPLSSQFGPHQRHEALLWKGRGERGRAARTSSLCRPQEEPPTVLTKRWRACYIVQVMKLFTLYCDAGHGTREIFLAHRGEIHNQCVERPRRAVHRLRNPCHIKKKTKSLRTVGPVIVPLLNR